MPKKLAANAVREAIGIFFDAQNLQAAVADLKRSGFSSDVISLLASEYAVKEHLGDVYREVHKGEDTESGAHTAFVAAESMGDVLHGIIGSLVLIGATVTGGAVVASIGALASALITACTGVAAVAGVGAALAAILYKSDAEYLEEQVDVGHMLLFVRTGTPEQEQQALDVLSKHAAYDAKVYAVKALRKPKKLRNIHLSLVD